MSNDPRVDLAHERTDMAAFRTSLAMERTMLAWIRTTLSLGSFGFGLVAFFRSVRDKSLGAETIRLHDGAVKIGLALILLGIWATLAAGVHHWYALRRLKAGGAPRVGTWSLSLTVALAFVVIGAGGLWALFER